MPSRLIAAALVICLVTSLLNVAIFVRQVYNPIRSVNVEGVLAKDWLKDRQFKKAVEEIAESVVEGKAYLDEADVTSAIESCVVRVGGKIKC